MKQLLLAGLLAAPALLSMPRAQAQSLPAASISDAYNIETNGPGVVLFPVTLSKISTTPVSIRWTTKDGTAKAGSDYRASSGTVSFAPYQRAALISVPVIGDSIEEADEYFSVVLSGAQGATLLDSVGNVGISDNDYAGTIAVEDVKLAEGNSGARSFGFRVTLSKPPLHTFSVGFQTADGSAKYGTDYTKTFGVVQFLAGEQSKIVNVPVLGDTAFEADETFAFQLGAPGYAFTKPNATGTIVNDDSSAQNRVGPSGGGA